MWILTHGYGDVLVWNSVLRCSFVLVIWLNAADNIKLAVAIPVHTERTAVAGSRPGILEGPYEEMWHLSRLPRVTCWHNEVHQR